MKEISEKITIGLLKNPLFAVLFIIGIGYIVIKYCIPIIKKMKKKK